MKSSEILYIVKECTNDVCDISRVGGQRRNGGEWWSEKVGLAVAEKEIQEWM